MDATALETQDGGLEESLGSTETLVANGDDLAVGKLVGLLEAGALAGGLDLLLEVESDVAELLLDVADDFSLGGGGEGVTALGQDLHQVVGQIATGHVDTGDGVGKRETLVDGDHVSDTVTGVEHDTGGTSRGVQGEHGLDGDVESGGVERLEDNLRHLLTVGLGVDGGLGEQDGVLLGGHTQLVVEGVVPNLLHVVPVGDHTVLDGVSQREDTTLRLCLVTDIGVLLAHTDHDTVLSISRWSQCRGGGVSYPWWRGRPTMDAAHLSVGVHDDLRAAAIAIDGSRPESAEAGYSRKTARGASSPAKPALHIPELAQVSSSPWHQAREPAGECGDAALRGCGRGGCCQC